MTDDIEYKYKPNLTKRIFATLFDFIVFFLSIYVYALFFGEPMDEGGYEVKGWFMLPMFMIWVGYFVIFEATQGATLGHLALNLKVLKDNRREIGYEEALRRHIIDPVDLLLYGIPALITIKYSEKHQRLGDMFAKTVVVDMSDPEQYKDKEKENQLLT